MIKDNILHKVLHMYQQSQAEEIVDMTLSSSFLKPDQSIIDQLKNTLDDEIVYTYSPGAYQQKFKTCFIEYINHLYSVKLKDTQILPCGGTNQIIASTLFSLLENGDTILLPSPGYPAYQTGAQAFHLNIFNYNTMNSSEEIYQEIITKINSVKPKLVLLNFPNNPTGKMLTQAQYKAIIKASRENDCMILNDCILNDFDFYQEKFSIFNTADSYENILELHSFSKAHALSGIRVGCIYGDEKLLHSVRNARYIYEFDLGALALNAGILTMQHGQEMVQYTRSYVKENLDVLIKTLNETNTDYIKPKGGVSILAKLPVNHINAQEFCLQFYEQYGIKVLPGTIYGEGFNDVFRITLMQKRQAFHKFSEKYKAYLDQMNAS